MPGRNAATFVNRNTKVTDEYLRCLELNPKQPKECDARLLKNAKMTNGLGGKSEVKAQDGGR